MRGIRTAGLGFAVALAAPSGYADDTRPAAAPAARLGKIRVLPDAPAPANLPGGVIARGQAAAPPPAAANPGNGILGMPRMMPPANVTEIRSTAGTAYVPAPSMPAATTGQPVVVGVGQPFPAGQPYGAGITTGLGHPIAVGHPAAVGSPIAVGQPYPGSVYVGQPGPVTVAPVAVSGPISVPAVCPAGDGLAYPTVEAPVYGGGPTNLLTTGG
ncbi:MAG: hypothetical protein ACRC7O_02745, partial [Fimbriiglobus sp.]